jgi:haloacid dehalogenase superfamily, subfamily IA, variant 3 with third motif having DD or ED/haloacid dehalogenase superfamily, subfamily IA, variant 1 with third motif having Dx(3-4)D or Dx(3-4)E
MGLAAAIFDLDGTLVDNNPYHIKAWKEYLKRMGRELSDEEYKINFNGRTNRDVVEYLHGKKMTDEEAAPYYLEKEAMYREIYKPYINPIPGLIDLLQQLKSNGILMAIATSGITVNIEFMFNHLPIRQYFNDVVHSSHIKKGKPDPEIYLKTAERLNVNPSECIVFEDALVGIQSAKGAGMKVIALTTTHTKKELSGADLVIKDYTEITIDAMKQLLNN